MSAQWMDVMPVIPLARGVPVYTEDPALDGVTVASFGGARSDVYRVFGDPYKVSTDDVVYRVNLGDPQGMAYALRWLATRCPESSALIRRFWCGKTTDEDRLNVAQNCVETLSGEVT